MQWICYLEILGLYAESARAAGLCADGRPIAILHDGLVCDGCQLAFTQGLTLGVPARQVLRDVPAAALLPLAQVDAMARARSWWEACYQHTPYIEPLELHQTYLALPFPDSSLTKALRSEVAALQALAAANGIIAFAGIAPSKLVARAAALASRDGWLRRPGTAMPGADDSARPGRVTAQTAAFVCPGEEARFLSPLPIRYLPAPPEVQRRLARLGIRTIGEAARIPEGEWLRQLGPLGRQLAAWSRGLDSEPVKCCYPPRVLERRLQFRPEVRDRAALELVLARSAVSLSQQLTGRGEGCQRVALTLEPAGGNAVTCERTLAKLQQASYPLGQALQGLLGDALQEAHTARDAAAAGEGPEMPIAGLTAALSLIGPMPWQQLDFWGDRARFERDERLQRALSLLHERFPVRVVGLGTVRAVSWREQMLQYSDPYRWVGST